MTEKAEPENPEIGDAQDQHPVEEHSGKKKKKTHPVRQALRRDGIAKRARFLIGVLILLPVAIAFSFLTIIGFSDIMVYTNTASTAPDVRDNFEQDAFLRTLEFEKRDPLDSLKVTRYSLDDPEAPDFIEGFVDYQIISVKSDGSSPVKGDQSESRVFDYNTFNYMFYDLERVILTDSEIQIKSADDSVKKFELEGGPYDFYPLMTILGYAATDDETVLPHFFVLDRNSNRRLLFNLNGQIIRHFELPHNFDVPDGDAFGNGNDELQIQVLGNENLDDVIHIVDKISSRLLIYDMDEGLALDLELEKDGIRLEPDWTTAIYLKQGSSGLDSRDLVILQDHFSTEGLKTEDGYTIVNDAKLAQLATDYRMIEVNEAGTIGRVSDDSNLDLVTNSLTSNTGEIRNVSLVTSDNQNWSLDYGHEKQVVSTYPVLMRSGAVIRSDLSGNNQNFLMPFTDIVPYEVDSERQQKMALKPLPIGIINLNNRYTPLKGDITKSLMSNLDSNSFTEKNQEFILDHQAFSTSELMGIEEAIEYRKIKRIRMNRGQNGMIMSFVYEGVLYEIRKTLP